MNFGGGEGKRVEEGKGYKGVVCPDYNATLWPILQAGLARISVELELQDRPSVAISRSHFFNK